MREASWERLARILVKPLRSRMISQGCVAGPQKTMLQQLRDPFSILLVGLATRHILDVLRAFAKTIVNRISRMFQTGFR
jgi:hypothetical protein